MNNSVYGLHSQNQRDFYSPPARTDLCFDNKGMVTPAQSERAPPHTVRVDITEIDKSQTKPNKIRWRRRIRLPHVINVFVSAMVIAVLFITELGFLPGKKLGFTCNDPVISHKFSGETVSPVVLLAGSLILPLLVLLFTEVLVKRTLKKCQLSDLWFLYKECIIGCILVLLVTEVAKVLVGEHRPHFLDTCQPDVQCESGVFVQNYTCTNDRDGRHFVTDASRSFPSGHSSVSVFVGLYSAYILQTRLPTASTGRLLKPFLISVCLTWSLVCSLSRITDRRHHWWDVLAGMTLGALGALYTLKLVHRKTNSMDGSPRISTSTTTLLDVKNKDATSVVI